jgi:hypothetical protein
MITIKPQLPKAAGVDHRVGEASQRTSDLDARSIRVVTPTNGSVQLRGFVLAFAERHLAGFPRPQLLA